MTCTPLKDDFEKWMLQLSFYHRPLCSVNEPSGKCSCGLHELKSKIRQERTDVRSPEPGEQPKVMDFLRSFISGGVNQDFRPWARQLYGELYGLPPDPQPSPCPDFQERKA